MPSKWCPKCERIVSSNHVPNYYAWCGTSLKDEPLLPPSDKWEGGYFGMVEKAKQEYLKRQSQQTVKSFKQIKLF